MSDRLEEENIWEGSQTEPVGFRYGRIFHEVWYLSRKANFLCKNQNDFSRLKTNARRSWTLLIPLYRQGYGSLCLWEKQGRAVVDNFL